MKGQGAGAGVEQGEGIGGRNKRWNKGRGSGVGEGAGAGPGVGLESGTWNGSGCGSHAYLKGFTRCTSWTSSSEDKAGPDVWLLKQLARLEALASPRPRVVSLEACVPRACMCEPSRAVRGAISPPPPHPCGAHTLDLAAAPSMPGIAQAPSIAFGSTPTQASPAEDTTLSLPELPLPPGCHTADAGQAGLAARGRAPGVAERRQVAMRNAASDPPAGPLCSHVRGPHSP